LSDSTPGHIGQKYFAPPDGFTSISGEWLCPPQQDFFSLESFMVACRSWQFLPFVAIRLASGAVFIVAGNGAKDRSF
jgi:hypothetical protein